MTLWMCLDLKMEIRVKELENRVQQLEAELAEAVQDKRALEIFKRNEKRYKMLYDSVPLSYQSLDSKGCFIEVNSSWLSLLCGSLIKSFVTLP